MLFHTSTFAGFFLVVWCLYWVLRRPGPQNGLLVVASLVFYGFWDWRFVSLLLVSIIVDFNCGIALGRATAPRRRRGLLVVSLVVNLGLLGFFKYFGFFAESLSQLAGQLGLRLDPVTLGIVLPMGISFYTFQTLGYTIDVYRQRIEPCQDVVDFAAYVSFFPQLVAGPIERGGRLIPQLQAQRRLEPAQLLDGALIFCRGLFKKVVIADNVALIVDRSFALAPEELSPVTILLAVYAFAAQIYCDFSGYSDMAVGTGKCMGIELMRNFRAPYLAANPSEFWRRWHISLSEWLRDYLYIPLGGNRGSRSRQARNLLATMVLGGLWHGAAWTFVLWGLFHGVLLIGHRWWRDFRELLPGVRSPWLRALGRFAAVVTMFHFTCLGWLLFRAESVGQVFGMLGRLAQPLTFGVGEIYMLQNLAHFAWMILAMHLFTELFRERGHLDLPRMTALAMAGYMLYLVFSEGLFGHGQQFIYFQF